ncbi:hypothetical protein QJQ45_027219, partial [Haematococcus lacustris]
KTIARRPLYPSSAGRAHTDDLRNTYEAGGRVAPSEVVQMEDAKRAAAEAQASIEDGSRAIAHTTTRAIAAATLTAQQAYATALDTIDHAQEYVDAGIRGYRDFEDAAVGTVQGEPGVSAQQSYRAGGLTVSTTSNTAAPHAMIITSSSSPHHQVLPGVGLVAYSRERPLEAYTVFGTLALLSLPPTRRLLWRQTLGRLTNPQVVVQRNAEKVQAGKTHLADYQVQMEKLEQRMQLGQEEMERGYAKLKATRVELQRLGRAVSASQQVATGVVQQLRAINKVDASLALRGEAAAQVAALKAAHARITKNVYRIANQDI